jgi:hypothetical protein
MAGSPYDQMPCPISANRLKPHPLILGPYRQVEARLTIQLGIPMAVAITDSAHSGGLRSLVREWRTRHDSNEDQELDLALPLLT